MAGLQVGDVLVTVNGVTIESTADVTREISASGGAPVTLGIERGG